MGSSRSHRSSADGRDTYYAVDLAACRDQLRAASAAPAPRAWLVAAPLAPPRSADGAPPRVLFLCTGNSARSQMAEALLEHLSDGAVAAASAGSSPKPLHPNAVESMRARGIDISGNRTKHLDELVTRRFDVVITLCDRVREVCPEFPSPAELVHWSIPDPALEGDTDRATYPAFERTADELETRIRFLLHTLDPSHRQGGPPMRNDETVNVRYMVDDVDEADRLLHEAARLRAAHQRGARVRRRAARQPAAAARRAHELGRAPDARRRDARTPAAGTASTSSSTTSTPRSRGSATPVRRFRNDVIDGPGGKQILLLDPSGNVVELFQPAFPRPT